MVKFFDWFFSKQVGVKGEMFSCRTIPQWPEWLCESLTSHRLDQKWSDRLNDVGGTCCRCRLKEVLNP